MNLQLFEKKPIKKGRFYPAYDPIVFISFQIFNVYFNLPSIRNKFCIKTESKVNRIQFVSNDQNQFPKEMLSEK